MKNVSEQADAPESGPRRLHKIGTTAIFLLAALVLGLVILLHVFFEAIAEAIPVFDYSILSIITGMGGLLITTLIGCWVVFLSPLSLVVRTGVAVLGILSLVGMVAIVEPVNDGNVIPRGFRFRWQLAPDEKLSLPEVDREKKIDFSAVNANLASPANRIADVAPDTVEEELPVFNQFLGNQRNGAVSQVQLNIDWEQSPPQQLWKQPIGAACSGFAAANGYAVTMEQRGEEELTTCYSIETGETVWFHAEDTRHQSPFGGIGPRATPTIHEGKVYANGANGILLCLNGSDGSVVWRKDMFELMDTSVKEQQEIVTWGRSASPLIFNDWLITPGGGSDRGGIASLFAFDKDTGEEIWRAGTDQISYASPSVASIDGKDQIVLLNEKVIVGYDPMNGKELWRFKREGNSGGQANTSQPIYLGNGRFLATKGYGLGAEIFQVEKADDTYTARSLKKNHRALKTKFTNCVVKDGYAYGLSDGILQCVELETLDSKWKRGRFGHGQILLVKDSILVLTEDGDVVLVDASPESFAELGRIEALEGVTWNTLCLVGDRLLIRNAEMAACWKLPTVSID